VIKIEMEILISPNLEQIKIQLKIKTGINPMPPNNNKKG